MRTTVLIFLTVFVYAVLVMLQGEAAPDGVVQNLGNVSSLGNSTPLCDVFTEPRTGRGDCAHFCNTLFKAFKFAGHLLSKCLDKCKELNPVNKQDSTGNSENEQGSTGNPDNGEPNPGDPLCDILTIPRRGRDNCPYFCNDLYKVLGIVFPTLSQCLDKCDKLYPKQ